MIPHTDLYLLRKLMFLLVDGRYYHTSNAKNVSENYLTLCGLKFPLTPGRSLAEEESTFMKRNTPMFQEFKSELKHKINSGEVAVQDLEEDIKKKKDIAFFLEQVCVPHTQGSFDRQQQKVKAVTALGSFYSQVNDAIFPKIIDKDYAVINGRLYPLVNSQHPIFASLRGINYTLAAGEKTVEEADSAFQQLLYKKLESETYQSCSRVHELEKTRILLANEIETFSKALKIAVLPHAFELGDLGYDTSAKLIYWLIPPHYNHTTGTRYSEGQSAATLPLEGEDIGATGKFAERRDRNSRFNVSSASHCLGDCALRGNTLEHKLIFLREFANVVETNQAFYQISNSSDSDSSY